VSGYRGESKEGSKKRGKCPETSDSDIRKVDKYLIESENPEREEEKA